MTATDPFQHPTYPYATEPAEPMDTAVEYVVTVEEVAPEPPPPDLSAPGWHDISGEGRDWMGEMGTTDNVNISDSAYGGEAQVGW